MTFWDFFWLMLWAFLFISYLMVIFQVVTDVFRDRELNGWVRAIWLVALVIAPPITALVYVIARGRGMTQRQESAVAESRSAAEDYIRSVAGRPDPASQIAQAKGLLDQGVISAPEYEQLKAKALV